LINADQVADIEKRLRNWAGDDSQDDCDLLHGLFRMREQNFSEWMEVADEGRRVWNLMFSDDVEESSPVDGVFGAIAASAYNLALSKVANEMGLSVRAVESALDPCFCEFHYKSKSFVEICMAEDARMRSNQ
jgi:hypothetical protein